MVKLREVPPHLLQAQRVAPLRPDPWAPAEGGARRDPRAARWCFFDLYCVSNTHEAPQSTGGHRVSQVEKKPVRWK